MSILPSMPQPAREIVDSVLDHLNVSHKEVFSPDRTKRVVFARIVIMRRLRTERKYSFERIGEIVGRHYSSVIRMIKCVEFRNDDWKTAIRRRGK